MNALWSDDAILAFTFYSRVLFETRVRLTQWVWLKVWRVDALNANRRIFIIYVIDDANESLQPYFATKNALLGDLGMLKNVPKLSTHCKVCKNQGLNLHETTVFALWNHFCPYDKFISF